MMPSRRLLVVILWWTGFLVSGQDMRGSCVGCGDLYRKCELSCLLPRQRKPPETKTELKNCLSHCNTTCELSDEATLCLSCMESCSSTYNKEMRTCLQQVDATTTMTFEADLDACSIEASSKMDSCSQECYGGDDGFGGWTPDSEEGRPSNGSFSRENFVESCARTELSTPRSRRRDEHPPGSSTTSYVKITGIIGVVMVITGCILDRFSSPIKGGKCPLVVVDK